MPEYLDVYRLEHATCPESPGHGPFYYPDRCNALHARPGFGTNGVGPFNGEIQKHESCGVVFSEIPGWWNPYADDPNLLEYERAGWIFAHYAVPAEECRDYCKQILFPARQHYRVGLLPWREVPMPEHFKPNEVFSYALTSA